ncbi:ATP-dependent helicase [Bacillus sp. M6-12]|uniref:DEAD/DEAH box helicase n=1 Tax=Bacillus sp. M6-12 TaxID=2054166 RepID=UPI000C77D577|nr:DEAD/DEAH box helicase [Bacillus sp. M6-12]PLS17776.1 ATP-dependent helicase [Bacillus sp. M6-12]
MLNTGKIHIQTSPIGNGKYALSAVDEDNRYLNPSQIQRLLFTWDSVSHFGTKVEIGSIGNNEVILVDGWGLLNLFAKEGFNSFIEWDWCDLSSLCLSAAPVLAEAIESGIPVPDFHSLEQERIGWRLPEQVEEEFDESFWNESVVPDSPAAPENSVTVKSFVEEWYNDAVSIYLEKHSPVKERWRQAVRALKETRLSANDLHAFFNEESWKNWLGLQEDTKPFTAGLRLTEPFDGEGPWKLEITLRSKKDDLLLETYPPAKWPRGWKKYIPDIENETKRWFSIIPWLEEKGSLKQELTEFEAWEFLTDASEKLMFLGAEILLPSWWMTLKESSLKVKAKVKNQSSRGPSYVGLQAIMDFDWRFSMNGKELTEQEFQALVNEKRRLIYIRGQWVKLDPAFIRQIQDMVKTANQKGIHLNELLQQELLDFPEDGEGEDEENADMMRIQFELNQDLKRLVNSLRETRNIPLVEPPADLQGDLRPYQKLGMSWLLFLREHGFGACLADDMGLGKTVQMIAYLLHVKANETSESGFESHEVSQKLPSSHAIIEDESSEDFEDTAEVIQNGMDETSLPGEQPKIETNASLIVCPTSVLGNWQKELERFAPNLKVVLHYGSNRPKGDAFAAGLAGCDVLLTSYGLSHMDFDELSSMRWNSIILDEAQNIKNPGTKQSRAVRKLEGRHQIALTGTPMENRLNELWAIFDFINKGYLGTLGQFQEKYVATIEREQQTGKIKELQRLIQPFLLRRTKKDKEVALNLPDKQEQKEFVPLTTEQASLYEQLIRDTFAELEQLSAFERKGQILTMLNKLKQLCNHPALYLKEEEHRNASSKRSGKLEKLTELVDAVHDQNESCLIFTQYIGMGEMIKELLETRYGIEAPFLNGSMGKKQRDDLIERFQNGDFPFFILSLKAGGTGLNLTAANHVIHYDRWWNPAVENQATDRAYRIGQKRFVHVHKLICTGTLEEKIDAMLDKKQSLNDEIISSENWITELSTEELKDLVALH